MFSFRFQLKNFKLLFFAVQLWWSFALFFLRVSSVCKCTQHTYSAECCQRSQCVDTCIQQIIIKTNMIRFCLFASVGIVTLLPTDESSIRTEIIGANQMPSTVRCFFFFFTFSSVLRSTCLIIINCIYHLDSTASWTSPTIFVMFTLHITVGFVSNGYRQSIFDSKCVDKIEHLIAKNVHRLSSPRERKKTTNIR